MTGGWHLKVAKPHLPAQQRQTERLDLGLLNSVRRNVGRVDVSVMAIATLVIAIVNSNSLIYIYIAIVMLFL